MTRLPGPEVLGTSASGMSRPGPEVLGTPASGMSRPGPAMQCEGALLQARPLVPLALLTWVEAASSQDLPLSPLLSSCAVNPDAILL